MDVAFPLFIQKGRRFGGGVAKDRAGPGGWRIHVELFFGVFPRSKKVSKKWCPRVPKWTPKVDQNQQKGRSGGVSKRDLKKGPSPGPGKVRFCYYLLHFRKVGPLKKVSILEPFWDPFWAHGLQYSFQGGAKRGKKGLKKGAQIWGRF